MRIRPPCRTASGVTRTISGRVPARTSSPMPPGRTTGAGPVSSSWETSCTGDDLEERPRLQLHVERGPDLVDLVEHHRHLDDRQLALAELGERAGSDARVVGQRQLERGLSWYSVMIRPSA